jgi:hypothetical protein
LYTENKLSLSITTIYGLIFLEYKNVKDLFYFYHRLNWTVKTLLRNNINFHFLWIVTAIDISTLHYISNFYFSSWSFNENGRDSKKHQCIYWVNCSNFKVIQLFWDKKKSYTTFWREQICCCKHVTVFTQFRFWTIQSNMYGWDHFK